MLTSSIVQEALAATGRQGNRTSQAAWRGAQHAPVRICKAHRRGSPLVGKGSPQTSSVLPGPWAPGLRRRVVTGAVMAPSAPAADGGQDQQPVPGLGQVDVHPFIDAQGMVLPPAYKVPGGVQPAAYVFAVLDSHQKLQYIGFSVDLRNTLRTLLGRRPDKAFYYKAHPMPALDQAAMVAVREAWFHEAGGAPPGNKLALERGMWQQPVDAFAVSSRGKRAAAEDQARQILEDLKTRGLQETFTPNPELLAVGQVDFLPSADMSPEAREALLAAQKAASAANRVVHTVIDGQERTFQLRVVNSQATGKGGFMTDVRVTLDNRETVHRVIVGKQYVEGMGLEGPEPALEAAMAVLLSTKMVRHTTGVMGVGQFPVNYFTVSEVEQWFGPEFREAVKISTGKALEVRSSLAWRFTRLHSYNAGGMLLLEGEEDSRAGAAPGHAASGQLGTRTSSFVFE